MKTGITSLTLSVLLFAVALAASKNEKALPTIESTGEILGVSVGMTLDQARKKLDPLRAEPSTKEKEGGKKENRGREIWKLKNTHYQWIMLWPNDEGKITRIAASLRAEHYKPFAEIGDLDRSATKHGFLAVWDVKRTPGKSFRLIAKGADYRAWMIYLLATGETEKD